MTPSHEGRQELERSGTCKCRRGSPRAIERARADVSLLDAQVRSADVRAPIEGTSVPARRVLATESRQAPHWHEVADLRADADPRAFVDEPELAAVREGLRGRGVVERRVDTGSGMGRTERGARRT